VELVWAIDIHTGTKVETCGLVKKINDFGSTMYIQIRHRVAAADRSEPQASLYDGPSSTGSLHSMLGGDAEIGTLLLQRSRRGPSCRDEAETDLK
jgi:hypothetical protein